MITFGKRFTRYVRTYLYTERKFTKFYQITIALRLAFSHFAYQISNRCAEHDAESESRSRRKRNSIFAENYAKIAYFASFKKIQNFDGWFFSL
jgi:hypothetical protein